MIRKSIICPLLLSGYNPITITSQSCILRASGLEAYTLQMIRKNHIPGESLYQNKTEIGKHSTEAFISFLRMVKRELTHPQEINLLRVASFQVFNPLMPKIAS